jgi:S1-C subfamily serine protease
MMVSALLLTLLPGQFPTIDSRSFPKERQAAALAGTVRILNTDRGIVGGGAILGRSGPLVYILTAEHVVHEAERMEVHTFTNHSYPKPANIYKSAEVVARSRSSAADLALLRLATGDALPGTLSLCPPRSAPRGGTFPVLSVGCGGGEAPTCEEDKVERAFWVEKMGLEGKALFWRTGLRPVKGRSGGPLLDRDGKLLGICSVANDNAGYYCHLDEVRQFLRQSGCRWLAPSGE